MNNTNDIKEIYKLASKRLKLFRKYRGLTQEQLSENSTFSRGFIGNIESEKTEQTFSLAVLYYFALELDIPIELFVKKNIDEELTKMGIDKKLLK